MSQKPRSNLLFEHTFDVKFTVRIPTARTALIQTIDLVSRAQRPFRNASGIVRREMTSVEILAVVMALALVLSSGTGTSGNSPLADTQPWRDIYAALFLISGIGAVVYNTTVRRFSIPQEFYLRLGILGLAFIGALGWGLLTALSVIAFHGDWVRVAPWLFITHFFARACATYVDFVDRDVLEQLRARLPELPPSPSSTSSP